jgi:hypothetical protein
MSCHKLGDQWHMTMIFETNVTMIFETNVTYFTSVTPMTRVKLCHNVTWHYKTKKFKISKKCTNMLIRKLNWCEEDVFDPALPAPPIILWHFTSFNVIRWKIKFWSDHVISCHHVISCYDISKVIGLFRLAVNKFVRAERGRGRAGSNMSSSHQFNFLISIFVHFF